MGESGTYFTRGPRGVGRLTGVVRRRQMTEIGFGRIGWKKGMSDSGRIDRQRPWVVDPSLSTNEAKKVRDQRARKLSSADQARIASQAGYQRLGAHRGKRRFDCGDSSLAAIPLPSDDVDPDAWSSETLEDARARLASASEHFGEMAESGVDFGEAAIEASFFPTEDDVTRLKLVDSREPPPLMNLKEVSADVSRFFSVDLDDEVPTGHKLLATALLVAGESKSVAIEDHRVNDAKLAAGIKKVAEKSNQAVAEAHTMNSRIEKQVSFKRTFVVKR